MTKGWTGNASFNLGAASWLRKRRWDHAVVFTEPGWNLSYYCRLDCGATEDSMKITLAAAVLSCLVLAPWPVAHAQVAPVPGTSVPGAATDNPASPYDPGRTGPVGIDAPPQAATPVIGSSIPKTSDIVIDDPSGRKARAEGRRIRCNPLAACETDGSLIQGR